MGEDVIKKLYGQMRSVERALGGGEGVAGLYGSITQGSMEKVIQAWKEKCEFGRKSIMCDIGAGLARPLLHAIGDGEIDGSRSFGIEIDMVKCEKAAGKPRHIEGGISTPSPHSHTPHG